MSLIKKLAISKKLDWELLKRFNIVANSSGFSEAAKEIGTSQGALVKQIDTLEQSLGEELFIRSAKNRTFELTPAGNLLAAITNKMNNIVVNQITKNLISEDNTYDRKDIKIITTPGISTTLLPKIIIEFLQEYPNVKFEIITKRNTPQLNIGEIIIRDDFISQPGFKMDFLLQINTSFYASQSYLKKNGIPNSYTDLLNHKILSIKYFNISSTDRFALNQDSFIYIDPWIQSDYISFLIAMALRDQGIIELPLFHPNTKRLIKINELKGNTTSTFVGYLNVEKQDNIIYAFINFLKQKLNEFSKLHH